MNTVMLPYGSGAAGFQYDPQKFEVVAPPERPAAQRKDHLIDSPPVEELARHKRVLIVVSDLTRPTGSREFLPPLLETLRVASKVSVIFATGLHRPLDEGDKIAVVGQDVFRSYSMLDHRPAEGNTFVGTTSRGNPVELDSQVFDHDLIVLTGSIGFHYFAGFAGGRKSLLPGIAAQSSIYFNHLLVLDPSGPGRNPAVQVARLDGNPVHEDMEEAAKLVDRPLFVYNTILDRRKRIESVYAGHWVQAHRSGSAHYVETHSVRLRERRSFAIVSAGGFPRDINVIQAHKAIEFAQHAVKPGGTIICLAECREGPGHSSFYPWFRHRNLDEFESELRRNYEVYGQTAYSFLTKARRYRLILVSSLGPEVVEMMGCTPASSLDEALGIARRFAGESPGYILPFGSEILPVVE